MKKYILCFTFSISLLSIFSQNSVVTGILKDAKDNTTLIGASAIVLRETDSSLYKGNTSDIDGVFVINQIAKGTYIFKVSYLGYIDYFQKIEVVGDTLKLPAIIMKSSSQQLKDVVITTTGPTAVQKGDTTQYNASSYKTNPDANAEDLVTKMAGISTQNGTVQAHGEDVKRVLVDGKPFFGDDVNAVLKNLPADVIDKIQFFDQQSEQSQFSGVNDGNTTKTINIVTKPGMKNGTFGRILGAYGYKDVYKVGGNINFFDGNRRISIVGLSNNTNEQNFSAEDITGIASSSSSQRSGGSYRGGGSGGGQGGSGGNNTNNFLVNDKNGISTTHALGINYSDKWGKNIDVTGSYFFNQGINKTLQTVHRDYVLASDSGQVYNENGIASSNNMNLLFRHRFNKKGRTLSITLTTGINGSNGTNDLYASNNYYTKDTATVSVIDQQSKTEKKGSTIGGNLTYTEPLGEKSALVVNYANTFQFNNSDKKTYNYTLADERYSNLDTTLSNQFDNTYVTYKGGLGYRFNTKKVQLTATVNYQQSILTSDQLYPYQFTLRKQFENVLPSAMLRYRLNTKTNVRIFYRTQTNAPSITQLQNVLNNSNPLQLSMGNPNLKQSYSHNLFMRYSSTSTEKSTAFFVMLSGNYSESYITNSTFIANTDTTINNVQLARGTQLSTPVNLSGYSNIRGFISYGFPLKPIKSILNFTVGSTFNQTPGMVNALLNHSNSQNYSLQFSINSNVSKNVDFTVSSNSNYTNTLNSINSQLNNSYFNQSSRLKLNLIFLSSIVLNTELNHQYYEGLSAGYNPSFLLWNWTRPRPRPRAPGHDQQQSRPETRAQAHPGARHRPRPPYL